MKIEITQPFFFNSSIKFHQNQLIRSRVGSWVQVERAILTDATQGSESA